MKTIRKLSLMAVACLAAFVAGIAHADYQSTILSDSPAGYWRLGDMSVGQAPLLGTGDAAANSGSLGAVGNGYFLYGAMHPVAGALAGSADTAVGFDGWKSRVDIPFDAALNPTNFTVEMWVKITNTTGNRAVSPFFCRDTNSQRGVLFYANNGGTKWQFRTHSLGTARNISSTNDVQYNTWVHLVGTHENITGVGSVMRLYLNGQEANAPLTNAASSYTPNTAAPIRIGAGNTHNVVGDFFWPGSMDEVAIYPSALTASQVLVHYENGTNASRTTPYETLVGTDNPTAYYRFSDAAGGNNSPTPAMVNGGSLGAAANGVIMGVTNTAAAIPGVTNGVVGGVAGVLTADPDTAILMNGRGGMVSVPHNAGLNPGSFSVECWARLDAWANAHQAAVSGRNGRNDQTGAGIQNGYILYAAPSGGLPRWEYWTGPGWQTVIGPMVTIGQLYHLVATYDASSMTKLFYVDGQIVGGATGVTVTPNDARSLRIGSGENENGGNFFWNGALDEVAVYLGTLSGDRVSAHYQAGSGVPPAATTPPSFTVNPVATTNWAPAGVTLTAVVVGSLPMQLQWYQVSVDGLTTNRIAGATNMALTISPTAVSDSGSYYLAATNSMGSAESAVAWVEILPNTPPSFSVDLPTSLPVYVGGTAGFYSTAYGTPPMTYLLLSNSVEVAVSSSGVFRVAGVQYASSNVNYSIRATNLHGAANSVISKLTVLTAPASSFAAVATNLNPTGYWRLGEPSGTAAWDYWGGWHGDYTSAGQDFTPGALVDDDDGCMQTVGSGTYARVRDVQAFNFNGNTSKFSCAAWINANSWPATGVRFFSTRRQVGATAGYGFGIWNGNSFRFTAFGVTDIAQTLPTINLGQWYHVACVNSNTTVYFYLNGVYQGAGNGNHGGIRSSPYPLQFGGNPNFNTLSDEEPFDGLMDEALVFDRMLSAAEIKALYDARYGSLVRPSIVKQPEPAQIYLGGTARFSVEVTGSSPLSYQWKTNGTAIAGATNSSLVVPGVTAGMNGLNYSVTTTNLAGSTNSASATLSLLTPSGYAAAVTGDSPTAFWRLGETVGSLVANDTWGSHNGAVVGGTVLGGTGAVTGDVNTSANFNGSDAKVEVTYAPELNTSNFTVECWARVSGGAGVFRSPVSSRNEVQGTSQGGFILYATAANVWSFWTGTGTGWEALDGPAVVENEWAHLVATFDGTTKRFYVNGTLVGSAASSVVVNPLRPLRIGAGRNERDPGEYYFFGDVDEVAIYDRALSADRVAYHYDLGVYSTTTAPFFTGQPQPVTGIAGSTVTLAAGAHGSVPLSYQWEKQGVGPVAGATQSTLTLSNVYYTDAGNYRVVVTNNVGSTNSDYAALVVLAPPSYANLTNDLVLHLRFDGNYSDTSGRANDSTAPNGSPTFLSGKVGQGVHIATTPGNNYLVVSDGAGDLAFDDTASFTVGYWLKYTGGFNDAPIIGNAINSTWQLGWVFTDSAAAGQIEWSLVSTANSGTYLRDPVPGCPTINDDTWHHVLGVVDRTNHVTSVYVDGVLASSWSIAGLGTLAYGNAITIGQDPTGNYPVAATFDLDDVGIWRRALTGYDAASIYAAAQNGLSFDVIGPVQLRIQSTGGFVDLSWQSGTLQQSTSVNGPYDPVPGAAAPFHRVTPTGAAVFYRVR